MTTKNRNEIIFPELNKCLNNLEIWGVIAGFGSIFQLHMGEKIKREKIVSNEKISPLLREYNGYYHLFVTCGWRLEKKGKVVVSHIQDEAKYITPGLSKYLVGQKIMNIFEIPNNIGLSIYTTGDIILTLFYDNIEHSDWVFFKGSEVYYDNS